MTTTDTSGQDAAHDGGPSLEDRLPDNDEVTLRGYQAVVDDWIRTVGVRYYTELTNTAILMEEVGEVARLMARVYGEQSFKNPEEAYDLGDEFADVLFVLVCLANQTGVDLTEAVRRNLKKKTERDWERHQRNEKVRRQPS